jgi:hypothetical protein
MRDPDPAVRDRLAVGVGDLAAGVAGLLRSLSRPGGTWPGWFVEPDAAPSTGEDDAWRAATARPDPAPPPAPKPMARKATRKRVPPPAAEPDPDPAAPKAAKKAARKAAKKAAKKAAPPAAEDHG